MIFQTNVFNNVTAMLKGTVARDFPPLVFSHQSTPFGLPLHLLNFLQILFGIRLVIQIRHSFCPGPLRLTNFFAEPGIKNLSGVGPVYYYFCRYTFYHHSLFKGYDKLLKLVVYFCALVIGLARWPIAHKQIPLYSP